MSVPSARISRRHPKAEPDEETNAIWRPSGVRRLPTDNPNPRAPRRSRRAS
jgi:hypothetical protein